MRPLLPTISEGAALVIGKLPLRLMSITFRHSAAVISSNGVFGNEPTQLTRISEARLHLGVSIESHVAPANIVAKAMVATILTSVRSMPSAIASREKQPRLQRYAAALRLRSSSTLPSLDA